MILYQVFYRIAFFVTAFIHLWFNDIVGAFVRVVVLCLSSARQPIMQSILRLHSVVLTCFVLAFCFNTISAEQAILEAGRKVLNVSRLPSQQNGRSSLTREQFDDVQTPDGFAKLKTQYNELLFDEFFVFKPSHPTLHGTISVHDLNCAVSKPNALYGSKITKDHPSIRAYDKSRAFTLHGLKIKPLNLPVGFVTISVQGFPSNNTLPRLTWNVDFPAGFHDVFDVRIEEFTKTPWEKLARLEVWADFHYGETVMDDWEFCIDDLEIELKSVT